MQDIWRLKVNWDEPLDNNSAQRWLTIANDLQIALKAEIPRQYFPAVKHTTSTLHVFVDSSIKAYGAVAYLQYNDQVSFVMAKNRVAPLKDLSLPQLELMAALIGARMATFLQTTLNKHLPTLDVKLWSDSQVVLKWLCSKRKLTQFVSNRVREINQLVHSTVWSYCPTSDNPADLLTRGITTSQLTSSILWNKGPSWLCTKSHWPMWNPTKVLLAEIPQTEKSQANEKDNHATVKPGIHCIISISHHSNLNTLLHISAYVLRFVGNIKGQDSRKTGPLTVQEVTSAELKWIESCQNQCYGNEIHNISTKSHQRLPLVRQLRLFLDKTGLIRCGGRIHNAPLSEATKFPLLLPSKHPFTNLVIEAAHVHQLHSGLNATVTALRQKFWIPSIRQRVKKLLRQCVTCKKVGGRPYSAPDPAPLPKVRLCDTVPFLVTGVDFTGALYVYIGKEETKVYICLFTCAVSRAVHLEVVNDLSEETFLQAFRRFASRKSLPQTVISDNASTYHAAADELRHLFQSLSLKEEFSRRGVDWQFIPKRAPWYGGFWERLIGLTKTALKKVLGRAHVSLSTLQTVIVEIEAILNDRPLTFLSSDLQDSEPVTPAHLLYGRRITSLPYPAVERYDLTDPDFGNDTDLRKRSKTQALLLKHFWTRWNKEYMTSLREFHRTTGNNNQRVKVGDVVLVHDDCPRIKWKLAVIESLITGGDGLVRAANIRTSRGRTNRPITKLYPLEVSETTSEGHASTSEADNLQQSSVPQARPRRAAAEKAQKHIKEWARELSGPSEYVEDSEH